MARSKWIGFAQCLDREIILARASTPELAISRARSGLHKVRLPDGPVCIGARRADTESPSGRRYHVASYAAHVTPGFSKTMTKAERLQVRGSRWRAAQAEGLDAIDAAKLKPYRR